MKIKIIIISMLINMVTYGQRNDVLTNNSLIVTYIGEFVNIKKISGFDITKNIDYIMIAPDSINIPNLGISYKDSRAILISNKATIDNVILKVILFRELSNMLKISYNSEMIMTRKDE